MNWYKKAQVNQTDNIVFDIYSKISNNIGGSWTVISDTKMMSTFQLQSYRIIKLDGKDVKRAGDYFWVEVKIFIYKALNILHPWSGTYENAENWQQGVASKLKDFRKYENFDWKEEETKRWEALKKLKPENSSTYDEQYGNKLIEFLVQIYGKKPNGKEAPSSVDKLKLFFEKGDIERIGVTHKGIDTPSDIAQYIQTTIDNYYKDDNEDDNEDDDRVEPIDPTGGEYIEPEVTYDRTDAPVLTPNFAQHKNWYKKAQFDYNTEEDRTTISAPQGNVIVTKTYPRYEFMEDLAPEEFETLNIDEDEAIAKIEHIEVDIGSRGEGVGGKLLEEAINKAYSMGVSFIYLNACPMGIDGLSLNDLTVFYQKYGFFVFKSQGNNNLMGMHNR